MNQLSKAFVTADHYGYNRGAKYINITTNDNDEGAGPDVRTQVGGRDLYRVLPNGKRGP